MKLNAEINIQASATKDKGIIRVELKGSLDNNNSFEFEFFVYTLISGGLKKLLIDIDDLQYLDSTGIGSLIAIAKKIRKENGETAITRYTAQIMTILRPINMEKFIQFFPTIEEGISYLKSAGI
ncbi:MAG: STAS domain-containing protein [Spirochaetes bacterium]|nr:STAS domain-containing protein [Spirochaetota bacterium]